MTTRPAFVHPSASVETDRLGPETRVWQFCVILEGAVIGSACNIAAHCFIENDVVIGDRVTVKNGVQLWDGIRIEDDVFIGPNATFTNDKHPRSRHYHDSYPVTVVAHGASIGANATILPGVRIGAGAMIGAGTVVTGNVPDRAVMVGNPGRVTGTIAGDGEMPRTNPDPPNSSGTAADRS